MAARWGRVGAAEVRSWRNSLNALAGGVAVDALRDTGVGVELKLPLTDRRIDACFTGRSVDARDEALLVESRQWTSESTRWMRRRR